MRRNCRGRALGRWRTDGRAWLQQNTHFTLWPQTWWVTANKHTLFYQ